MASTTTTSQALSRRDHVPDRSSSRGRVVDRQIAIEMADPITTAIPYGDGDDDRRLIHRRRCGRMPTDRASGIRPGSPAGFPQQAVPAPMPIVVHVRTILT